MVAIKIQSKEDIIAAYLTSLGFNPQQLPEIVPAVAAELDFRNGNGDELVKKIDAFLLRLARRTFSKTGLADEQLLAEFKLCFLLCNGADLCTAESCRRLSLPAELVRRMRERFVVAPPSCLYAEMKPQAIESIRPRKKGKKK